MIYIRLRNFRCYKDKTFEFENKGFNLLYGQSGTGKSTLFMAINFCLFGSGTKIIKYGETTCSVEMEFNNLKIMRSKRPNRVIVNDKYEDDVAQNMINDVFGTTFNITGYVEQNAVNSFIMMSPNDKLMFLEKFAFNDVNLSDIKIRCKSLVKRYEMALAKTQSQFELSQSYLNEITEPEEIEFPLGRCKNREISIKNEEIRYKNCDTKMRRSKSNIVKAQEELNDLRVLNSYTKSKMESVDNLINLLEELVIEEDKIEYIGDDELLNMRKRLESLIATKEIRVLRERYDIDKNKLIQMKDKENSEYNEQIESLGESLWEEYTKGELKENIDDTKSSLKDARRLMFLKSQIMMVETIDKEELDRMKEEYEMKRKIYECKVKQNKCYECPSCDNKLYINGEDKLECINDEMNNVDVKEIENEMKKIKEEIKNVEKKIRINENRNEQNNKINEEIEEIISQYEDPDSLNEKELEEYLVEYDAYYKSQIKKETRINELKDKISNGKYSSTIMMFEKELVKQGKEIELKSNDICCDDEIMSENELREMIRYEERNREGLERLENKREGIEKDKKRQMMQNDNERSKYIEKYGEMREESEIECVIEENKNVINEQGIQMEKHSQNLLKIEEYKKYEIEKNKYNEYKRRVEELQIKVGEDEERLLSVNILKDKILESEMIAIMNTIDIINTHAQIYLDNFFVEYPMTIILKCFKESKKSDKPQINMEIYYKDSDSDLTSLSGGELARVVLAFALSLSEMFNTPMLLLDESTASLDEDMTAIVFECIKENMRDKPVLVIGHQIVQGIFDRILKI